MQIHTSRVHPGRVRPHQHLALTGRWLGHLAQLEDVGGAVLVLGDRFHLVSPAEPG
jgi:hypothetical protein